MAFSLIAFAENCLVRVFLLYTESSGLCEFSALSCCYFQECKTVTSKNYWRDWYCGIFGYFPFQKKRVGMS